jgi:uncharacterized protein (DUF433 family)
MTGVRVTIIAGLCGGRPTIRGMRITVADALDLVASGMTTDEVLEDYAYLQREDVSACLQFAAQQAR